MFLALGGSLKTPGSYQGIASAMPQVLQKQSRFQPPHNASGEEISFQQTALPRIPIFRIVKRRSTITKLLFLRPIRQLGPLTTGN